MAANPKLLWSPGPGGGPQVRARSCRVRWRLSRLDDWLRPRLQSSVLPRCQFGQGGEPSGCRDFAERTVRDQPMLSCDVFNEEGGLGNPPSSRSLPGRQLSIHKRWADAAPPLRTDQSSSCSSRPGAASIGLPPCSSVRMPGEPKVSSWWMKAPSLLAAPWF